MTQVNDPFTALCLSVKVVCGDLSDLQCVRERLILPPGGAEMQAERYDRCGGETWLFLKFTDLDKGIRN